MISSDVNSCFQTIHDGHVAVHEDQLVVSSLLPARAWIALAFLSPDVDQIHGLLTVECPITCEIVTVRKDRLKGDDIENVVINQ